MSVPYSKVSVSSDTFSLERELSSLRFSTPFKAFSSTLVRLVSISAALAPGYEDITMMVLESNSGNCAIEIPIVGSGASGTVLGKITNLAGTLAVGAAKGAAAGLIAGAGSASTIANAQTVDRAGTIDANANASCPYAITLQVSHTVMLTPTGYREQIALSRPAIPVLTPALSVIFKTSGSTILVQVLNKAGLGLTASVFVVQFLTDYIDRLISLVFIFYLLSIIPEYLYREE